MFWAFYEELFFMVLEAVDGAIGACFDLLVCIVECIFDRRD